MSDAEEIDRLKDEERDLAATRDRAHRAGRILNDDLFKDAIQSLRDEAVHRLTHADPADVESLCQARLEYDALENVIGKMIMHVHDGQIADHALEQIKVKRSWLERGLEVINGA